MAEMEIAFEVLQSILGAGMAMLGVVAAVAALWYVLQVIAYWRIFAKTGVPGWYSLIPIFNDYQLYKLTWTPIVFLVQLVLAAASWYLNGYEDLAAVLNLISLVQFVLVVVSNYFVSRSFGHGVGYTIGLTILNPIFKLILGLGGDRYLGNGSRMGGQNMPPEW